MSSRGFTLIEVMLAVAIMAVAVVTLLLIQTEAIRMGGEADQLRLLSQLAQDKLHQLVLSQEESASGGFSDLHAGYTFSFVSAEERWKTPSSEAPTFP